MKRTHKYMIETLLEEYQSFYDDNPQEAINELVSQEEERLKNLSTTELTKEFNNFYEDIS